MAHVGRFLLLTFRVLHPYPAATVVREGSTMRWEYHVLQSNHSWDTITKELNRLGAEGWELVASENHGNVLLFKRRLEAKG
jgi:hypothetical protein